MQARGGGGTPYSMHCQNVDALEAAALETAIASLHAQVAVASQRVIPPALAAAVLGLPKERVKTAQRANGPDLLCHALSTVWRKLSRGGTLDAVQVATESEYGLRKEVTHTSAEALARAVIEELPAETWKHAADVRAAPDGSLLITTHLQAARQRLSGRLQCALCGDFFNNTRGLRDHQQVKHGETYEIAVEAVSTLRSFHSLCASEHSAGMLTHEWALRAAIVESDKRALPPLLEAARDGQLDTFRQLLQLPSDGSLLDTVREATLVAQGTTDRHGSTALHWSAGSGHMTIVRLLVHDLGIDISSVGKQKDRRTPLHWAARNGHLEVCRWLVENGADPDSRTIDGTTPLHWAVWRGQIEVADWLVDAGGADVHAINEYGCNAIQWAAQSDTTHGLLMCRWLKQRNLEIGKLNHNGHSALHKAAVKGNAAVCEWLLGPEVGLDVQHLAPDGDGNSPSVMAKLEGFADLAAWLDEWEAQRRRTAMEMDAYLQKT